MDLIAQLQAQPKLCDNTRAIWWDVTEPLTAESKRIILSSSPYLVHFANVDEVAFTCEEFARIGKDRTYPVGLHYALRDAGSWCEPLEFLRPTPRVEEVQRTPTIRTYFPREEDIMDRQRRGGELEKKWRAEHPGQKPPRPTPWKREVVPEPKRSVWGMHLVLPGLQLRDMQLYAPQKTVTHLTITLYEHFAVRDDPSLEEVLEQILDARQMPLLQHLHIRAIHFGARCRQPTRDERDPTGTEDCTWEKIQRDKTGKEDGWEARADAAEVDMQLLMLEDVNEWRYRWNAIKDAVKYCGDPRVTFEKIEFAKTCSDQLMDDVRKFTLQQWQERVHHGRAGPWKAPMTTSVRTDPPGGMDEQEEDLGWMV